MVENYLLQIGMRCGTVKNFNNSILRDMENNDGQHWYFLTPIKAFDKGNGLKECTVNMAYPFLNEETDTSEQIVIERLSPLMDGHQTDLLKILRKMLIVPSFTFSVVPFWANEKTSERNELKDFGSNRIHIINASIKILYRETWFKTTYN